MSAKVELAESMRDLLDQPLSQLRKSLRSLPEQRWVDALGDNALVYKKIWNILEGNQE